MFILFYFCSNAGVRGRTLFGKSTATGSRLLFGPAPKVLYMSTTELPNDIELPPRATRLPPLSVRRVSIKRILCLGNSVVTYLV